MAGHPGPGPQHCNQGGLSSMFGIGSTELLVIMVVALIVLGPKNLPNIARTLGKAMGEFRRVSTDFQRTLNTEIELDDHERRKKEAEKEFFDDKAKAEAPKAEQPKAEGAKPAAEAPTEAAGKNA
jgi:sec-independent protein translocase protein TatB